MYSKYAVNTQSLCIIALDKWYFGGDLSMEATYIAMDNPQTVVDYYTKKRINAIPIN